MEGITPWAMQRFLGYLFEICWLQFLGYFLVISKSCFCFEMCWLPLQNFLVICLNASIAWSNSKFCLRFLFLNIPTPCRCSHLYRCYSFFPLSLVSPWMEWNWHKRNPFIGIWSYLIQQVAQWNILHVTTQINILYTIRMCGPKD